MKGYRFYLDHDSPADKRRGKGNGNVIAVCLEQDAAGGRWYECQSGVRGEWEAVVPVLFVGNSPVCGGQVERTYIWTQTKHIPEARAREIHPNLFIVLDRIAQEEAANVE